jgi:5-methylcytosine-specific restriction endonuclease McrA
MMHRSSRDIALDLLTGKYGTSGAHPSRATVDIRVDLATLTELTETPGDLAGYGPVIADIARQVANTQHDARWNVTVTDGETNDVVLAGITRYRPTTQQRRDVHARHRTCIWPGCRTPADDADLDHTTPWADGGKTTTTNLAPLCRHHHRIRHQHQWTYQRLPNGGHQFTSPLGHTSTTRGPPP